MENDNLLKRCKTLEADFNALDTYLEKRDFVIQFHNEFDDNLDAKSLLNEFRKFNESNPPYTLNPKHNSSVVNEFSSKLEEDRKIKFDAFYKAIELLEIEFKKIEPKLILEIAVIIIIEIHKDDFDNDYKDLRKFANLLIKSPHHAHDKFFNNRIDLIYCRDLQMKIYKDYLFEPHVSIYNGYIDFFRFSIYDNTFFNYYKIDNEALAAKLKEYINTILNDEPTPSTKETLKDEKKTATEHNLLKELKSINLILVWLKVTNRLDKVFEDKKGFPKNKKGVAVRKQLIDDRYFEHIGYKTQDYTIATNDGKLTKGINCLLNQDEPKTHKNYPFQYNIVNDFKRIANQVRFKHLGLNANHLLP